MKIPAQRVSFPFQLPSIEIGQDNNCLCSFGLLYQNMGDWVDHKQQRFISHSFGGWKSKIRAPAWLGESFLPGHRLVVVSSHGGRNRDFSLGSLS